MPSIHKEFRRGRETVPPAEAGTSRLGSRTFIVLECIPRFAFGNNASTGARNLVRGILGETVLTHIRRNCGPLRNWGTNFRPKAIPTWIWKNSYTLRNLQERWKKCRAQGLPYRPR